MRIREVAEELQINLVAAYELAKREDFPSFTIGKRIIVPRKAFEQWLANQAKLEDDEVQHGWRG